MLILVKILEFISSALVYLSLNRLWSHPELGSGIPRALRLVYWFLVWSVLPLLLLPLPLLLPILGCLDGYWSSEFGSLWSGTSK